jgi:hypothetical protein
VCLGGVADAGIECSDDSDGIADAGYHGWL